MWHEKKLGLRLHVNFLPIPNFIICMTLTLGSYDVSAIICTLPTDKDKTRVLLARVFKGLAWRGVDVKQPLIITQTPTGHLEPIYPFWGHVGVL